MIVAPGSGAATGDVVHQVIVDRAGTACASYNDQGNHAGIGVGVAFDGDNLLVSCFSDSTVTVNDPITGDLLSVHQIAGASQLGALAYDGTRDILYGCSARRVVGIVDLAADTFTALFNTDDASSDGCMDGLAFDAGDVADPDDDTFWASHDVQSTVQRYELDGTLISSNAVTPLLNNFGNSGIATGGEFLYLANNGGRAIYEVAKDFSGSTFFASFDRRLEDLECDNVTFADDGVAAMWVNDAYDNIITAFEIPDGSCKFGGGVVECAEDGLAVLDPSGVASGTVHETVEPAVDPLGLTGTVHTVNCGVVVPVEDAVDGLLGG